MKLRITLSVLVIFVSACGGGGGGGGLTRSSTNASVFETTEFNAQEGLGIVKAQNMFERGGTGSGVIVGVADSGVDVREVSADADQSSHIDVDVAKSFDVVNQVVGSASDENRHGTHVAGIIAAPRNGQFMHGIAFDAQIANYRIMDADGFVVATDPQLANMLFRARTDGVNIMNNSWGSNIAINAAGAAAHLALLTDFRMKQKLMLPTEECSFLLRVIPDSLTLPLRQVFRSRLQTWRQDGSSQSQ